MLLRRLDQYFHFPAKFLLATNAVLFAFYPRGKCEVVILGDSLSASGGHQTHHQRSADSQLPEGDPAHLFCRKQIAATPAGDARCADGGLQPPLPARRPHQPVAGRALAWSPFSISIILQRVNDGFWPRDLATSILKTFCRRVCRRRVTGWLGGRLGGDEFCVVEKGDTKMLAGSADRPTQGTTADTIEPACPSATVRSQSRLGALHPDC